jgi:hypothetical protein
MNRILDDKSLFNECLDKRFRGISLREHLLNPAFCVYIGTTRRRLTLEYLRWLSARGSLPNLSRAGSYGKNHPVLRMADGKIIKESFAKEQLGFHAFKVFSSVLQLDVTDIEKRVRVLVAVARFSCLFWLYCIFCVCCVYLLLRFV